MLPPALAHSVIVLVTLVWLGNIVAPLLISSYTADPQLNLVFMSVVGGALALRDRPHGRHAQRSENPWACGPNA